MASRIQNIACCVLSHVHVMHVRVRCLLLQSSLAHEAATEWSLLTETLEPQLATAGVITGMGPRIAVVAALQQLAAAAGLTQMGLQQHAPKHQQQQQALSSAPCRAAAGYADRAAAAGVGLWHRWMQVSCKSHKDLRLNPA